MFVENAVRHEVNVKLFTEEQKLKIRKFLKSYGLEMTGGSIADGDVWVSLDNSDNGRTLGEDFKYAFKQFFKQTLGLYFGKLIINGTVVPDKR